MSFDRVTFSAAGAEPPKNLLSYLRINLSRSKQSLVGKLCHLTRCLTRAFNWVGSLLDPENDGIPRTRTVVVSLLGLAIHFAVGGFAIKYPNRAWKPVAFAVATTIEAAIGAFAIADLQCLSRSVSQDYLGPYAS